MKIGIRRILKLPIVMSSVVTLLLMGMALMNIPIYAQGATSATIAVNPPTIMDLSMTPGSTFSLNITIANFTHLWGYQYALFYNTTVINATAYTSLDSRFTLDVYSEIGSNFTAIARATFDGDHQGISSTGPMPVDRIDFIVTGTGTTNIAFLPLGYARIANVEGVEIPNVTVDGLFSNVLAPSPTLTITMTRKGGGKTETITLELVDEDHDGFITIDIENRVLSAIRRTLGTTTFDFPGEYTATQGAWTTTLSCQGNYTITFI